MYKNYYISKRYALDGSLSRGTANSFRYISTSELRVFNQCSNIDTGTDINSGISRSTMR